MKPETVAARGAGKECLDEAVAATRAGASGTKEGRRESCQLITFDMLCIASKLLASCSRARYFLFSCYRAPTATHDTRVHFPSQQTAARAPSTALTSIFARRRSLLASSAARCASQARVHQPAKLDTAAASTYSMRLASGCIAHLPRSLVVCSAYENILTRSLWAPSSSGCSEQKPCSSGRSALQHRSLTRPREPCPPICVL